MSRLHQPPTRFATNPPARTHVPPASTTPHHLTPTHQPGPTNSWFFVPIVLAAALLLDPGAIPQWENQPFGSYRVATSSRHPNDFVDCTPGSQPATTFRTKHPATDIRRRGPPASWHPSSPRLGGCEGHIAQQVPHRHSTRTTPPSMLRGAWKIPCSHSRKPMATKPSKT